MALARKGLGFMQAVQRLFIVTLAICVTLAASLGTLLFVSLIPFFPMIGKVSMAVLIIALTCVSILMLTFTYSQAGIMLSRRSQARVNERVIIAGDVVIIPQGDGTYFHASALHEQAKIAPPVAPPVVVEGDASVSDDTILELHSKGLSLRDIEKVLSSQGVKYHRIQKVTSAAKTK